MGRIITAVIHVIQENISAFDSQICNVGNEASSER